MNNDSLKENNIKNNVQKNPSTNDVVGSHSNNAVAAATNISASDNTSVNKSLSDVQVADFYSSSKWVNMNNVLIVTQCLFFYTSIFKLLICKKKKKQQKKKQLFFFFNQRR